jgi:hypothetical protein
VNRRDSCFGTYRQKGRGIGESNDRLGLRYQGISIDLRQDSQESVATSRQEDGSAFWVHDGGVEHPQAMGIVPGQKALAGEEIGLLEAEVITPFEGPNTGRKPLLVDRS